MNVMEINACNFGSTGNIMLQIAQAARAAGHTVITVCPDSRDNRQRRVPGQLLMGSRLSRNFHLAAATLTGREGMLSRRATAELIRQMKEQSIDLLHLHNLHGWYINLPMLFRYVKKNNIRVIWTLHDCWSFTGHCPYFDIVGCEKWKRRCGRCPQYKDYPRSLVDNSAYIYNKKKKTFTGVGDLTLVTPSKWLAGLVKQSFLGEYPVKVINNGIDLSIFKPTESNTRRILRLEDKKMVLGVAFDWGERKGFDVMCELARRLPDDYQVVLVGTNNEQNKQLAPGMMAIERTYDQLGMASYYTAADVFVNPTREDNFPTVNLEALACGTPVVTFRTGGSPEAVDNTCGIVVEKNDIDGMIAAIRQICETENYSKDACIRRASQFDKNDKFREYVQLYGKGEK